MSNLHQFWRPVASMPFNEQRKICSEAANFLFPDKLNTQGWMTHLMAAVLDEDREELMNIYDQMKEEGIIDYLRLLLLTKRQGDPLSSYCND